MPRLIVTTRKGEVREVESPTGLSVMAAIRDGGFDEMLALCGGCCSCATCHVHIDAEWLPKLPPISAEENDLLDSSSDRTPNSRLSCQIPLSVDLDGLAVTLAAGD